MLSWALVFFIIAIIAAVFGFVACVIIVIVSKFLGHRWLQRREDYYDRSDNDD